MRMHFVILRWYMIRHRKTEILINLIMIGHHLFTINKPLTYDASSVR